MTAVSKGYRMWISPLLGPLPLSGSPANKVSFPLLAGQWQFRVASVRKDHRVLPQTLSDACTGVGTDASGLQCVEQRSAFE